MLRRSRLLAALLACLGVVFGGAVAAHTHLKTSVPAAGASLAEAPTEIRLKFHDAIEASLSHVGVETNTGEPVPAGVAASAAGDKTLLVLRLLQPLKPGTYKVSWRVIAADTHKMRGSFSFQVRP
ncbi:MAG TPA: copper homeostasis periplasmic binding protein CopC [Hyphomicrobiaceae bacterium]|jgi:hypothetical protein|nr:copper homeostasis periplasmic binding protein CopC [Hyphomicrobiaceae bacterium]